MFSVGEVTVDLVPGLGGLASAGDNEIDFAGSEAFSGHDTSKGMAGRGKPRGISLLLSTLGVFLFWR